MANVKKDFFYTIAAPRLMKLNSDYILGLTIHDSEIKEPVLVRASIEDENNENGQKICLDVSMKGNFTQIVSIPTNDLSADCDYKLVLKGITGATLNHEASLDCLTRNNIILIQTDRGIYKPNDCIKFRIFVLDSHLKAATIDKNELSISFSVSVFESSVFFFKRKISHF